ncbi:MAG: EVE domain-containing protein [Rhodospirillaceae bacterium]|nr:EVE domain-containing protein [Rhodospirillaceae bacterium]
MAYWLLKSDPDTYGWREMQRDGRTNWDGVRNPQAGGYLRQMRVGDRALFYHSGSERAVVGIVEVARAAYPDPGDPSGRAVQVDVKAGPAFATPVTLAWIKAQPSLKDLPLIRQSRLSVMPIDPAAWAVICRAGGIEA